MLLLLKGHQPGAREEVTYWDQDTCVQDPGTNPINSNKFVWISRSLTSTSDIYHISLLMLHEPVVYITYDIMSHQEPRRPGGGRGLEDVASCLMIKHLLNNQPS